MEPIRIKDEENIKKRDINLLIEEYKGLIVKTVSSITNRYVSVESDDEFSIALMAFVEAVEKYEANKGAFASFAKLVISSRVKNYIIKESSTPRMEYIDEFKVNGIDIDKIYDSEKYESEFLEEEINSLGREIELFGFNFDDLVQEAPKHRDTRWRAINIADKVNDETMLKTFMYEKRRLPIKMISTKFSVTEKIIKGSKKFIISVVIILDKNLRNLKLWIRR